MEIQGIKVIPISKIALTVIPYPKTFEEQLSFANLIQELVQILEESMGEKFGVGSYRDSVIKLQEMFTKLKANG